jgi:hypothetical protein
MHDSGPLNREKQSHPRRANHDKSQSPATELLVGVLTKVKELAPGCLFAAS